MGIQVNFDGVPYVVPVYLDQGWADQVTNYLVSIARSAPNNGGGVFAMKTTVDLGSNYGMLAASFTAKVGSAATEEVVRIPNNIPISWRNAANTDNVRLQAGFNGRLFLNGFEVPSGLTLLAIEGRLDAFDVRYAADVIYVGNEIVRLGAADALLNALPVINGGTGADNAADALNNLLPDQAAHAGDVLYTDGLTHSWGTPPPGMSIPMTTQGDLISSGAGGTPKRVAGSTTATRKALFQTGDGTNAGDPVWEEWSQSANLTLTVEQIRNTNLNVTAVVTRVGRLVTMRIPIISVTPGQNNFAYIDISGIPSQYRPPSGFSNSFIPRISNASSTGTGDSFDDGTALVTDAYIAIFRNPNLDYFTATANYHVIFPFTIFWYI